MGYLDRADTDPYRLDVGFCSDWHVLDPNHRAMGRRCILRRAPAGSHSSVRHRLHSLLAKLGLDRFLDGRRGADRLLARHDRTRARSTEQATHKASLTQWKVILRLMLLIDAANVVGSRPNGWWRDRPGAARAFVKQVRAAVGSGRLPEPVVVVLEGAARGGTEEGVVDNVTVLHAPGSGDDCLLAVTADATSQVTLVSADRALCRQVKSLGADVASPGWLIGVLDGDDQS